MKWKILFLFSILILVAIAQSATSCKIMQDEDFLLLKGTIKINEIENNTLHTFAFRLFYFEFLEDERSLGWITLNKANIPDGFHMIPIGNIHLIFGIVRGQGGIEIP